ncbi:MAG: hypothetical protein KDC53_24230, partial [Saprospiraceae bacterium]|nr:hypothetical protein [Saprospiraceae bacterium]
MKKQMWIGYKLSNKFLILFLIVICSKQISAQSNLTLIGVFFEDCTLGEENDEFLYLYTNCGFSIADLYIEFDTNIAGSASGQNSHINLGGICQWKKADLSKYNGCLNFIAPEPTEIIPPNSKVIIELDLRKETYDLSVLCRNNDPIYVIGSSCDRTTEVFPPLMDSYVAYGLLGKESNKDSIVYLDPNPIKDGFGGYYF